MKRKTFNGSFMLLTIGIALSLGVRGRFTHDGNPVDGATVTFVPAGGGHSANGVTDASGKYSLTTFASGDGAVAGQYGVKIVRYEGGADEAAGGAGAEPEEPGGIPDAAGVGEEGEEESEPKNVLPEKYADPGTSELNATVGEGGGTFDFTLEG